MLSALVLWFEARQEAPGRRRSLWVELVPQLVLLAAVVIARRAVLHGWGGSGDARAGLAGTMLQIYGGFAETFTGA